MFRIPVAIKEGGGVGARLEDFESVTTRASPKHAMFMSSQIDEKCKMQYYSTLSLYKIL